MSQSFHEWLQSRLTAHGYPVGAIDGHFGPVSTRALKAFETANGLSPDGLADRAVIALLKLPASRVEPAIAASIPDRDDDDDPAIQRIALVDQRWPRQAGVEAFFGGVGKNLVIVDAPYELRLSFDKNTRARRLTLNAKVAPSAVRVLEAVADTYSAAERSALGLDVFGGAYNPRRMRGGSKWSMHAYGIALDFDPERNGLHVKAPEARLSHPDAKPFWDLWEAEGWLSLGRARNFDWMHVQAARL